MLPEKWIGRIFDQMLALYGTKFSALWQGSDLDVVRRVWAERLAGFHDKPEAIKAALDALDGHPFPPTLPEFLTLCRDAARRLYTPTSVASEFAQIEHKVTPEEVAEAKQRLKRGDPFGDRDPLEWARHPRSPVAVQAVIETAKRDWRFRGIVEALREQGVIDEGNVCRKVWEAGDKRFVAFGGQA